MKSSKKSNYPERKPEKRKSNPNVTFKSLEELSDWIEASLADLEKKYESYKTVNSMRVIKVKR